MHAVLRETARRYDEKRDQETLISKDRGEIVDKAARSDNTSRGILRFLLVGEFHSLACGRLSQRR